MPSVILETSRNPLNVSGYLCLEGRHGPCTDAREAGEGDSVAIKCRGCEQGGEGELSSNWDVSAPSFSQESILVEQSGSRIAGVFILFPIVF